ncbi:MAG: sec-independent protein translocase protein TatB [Polaribacter sp.]|jgi:sec-independent protein translocase protein TatB
MFDMGFTEVVLIGVVALVVIGPERLPGVAITVGKYVGRLKRFMTNVRADVESELKTDEIRKLLASQQEELSSLKDAVSGARKDFDMSDVAKSIDESVSDVTGTGTSPAQTPVEQDAALEQSEDWIPPWTQPEAETTSKENTDAESASTGASPEVMPEKSKSAS